MAAQERGLSNASISGEIQIQILLEETLQHILLNMILKDIQIFRLLVQTENVPI